MTAAARAILPWVLLVTLACSTDSPASADTTTGTKPDTAALDTTNSTDVSTATGDDAGTSALDATTDDAIADIGAIDAPDTETAEDSAPETISDAMTDTAADAFADAFADALDDTLADAAPDVGAGQMDVVGDATEDAEDDTVDGTTDAKTPDANAMPDAATEDTAPPPPCNPPNPKPVDPSTLPLAKFTDVTTTYGLDSTKSYGICAQVADLDGDGSADPLVIELSFTAAWVHVTLMKAGVPTVVKTKMDTTWVYPNMGCSVADMTGDGKPDLLAGGSSGLTLMAGDGKGGFVDVSDKWLPSVMTFAGWSMAPVDLDGDGDLDLFIGAGDQPGTPLTGGKPCKAYSCSYQGPEFTCVFYQKPAAHESFQDRVLIQGSGKFADATAKWKVPDDGIATNAAVMDLDGDGKPDVLVSDDFGGHRVLHNLGGAFKSYSTEIGFHPYAHGMGWGFADLDGDGKADLVLADLGPTPVYTRVKKKGVPFSFRDCGGGYGVWGPSWGSSSWSPAFGDLDHDGREDMVLGASVTLPPDKLGPATASCSDSAQGKINLDLLLIRGDNGFVATRMPNGPGTQTGMMTQQLADLDGDRDLDILQIRPHAQGGHTARVLRNDLAKKGDAVIVRLVGKGKNTDALGSTVRAKIDGKSAIRWTYGNGGYGGTPARWAHFGLGKAKQLSDIEVTWPDGKKSKTAALGPTHKKVLAWP